MELELIGLAVVIATAILLFVISTLGARTQSYEEAVAANRKLVAQRGLLDDPAKQKRLQQQQTKKNKKAGKKVKKEQAAAGNGEVDSETPVENASEDDTSVPQHGHVEFVETPIVTSDEHPKPPKSKKKSKDKVKPILINKDDPSCIADISTPAAPVETESANHFEQIHPRDEFELLRIHSLEKEKSDLSKKESKNVKSVKVEKPKVEKEKPAKTPMPPATAEQPKEQRKVKGKAQPPSTEVADKTPEDYVPVTPAAAIKQPADLTTDKLLKKVYPLETSNGQQDMQSDDIHVTKQSSNGPLQPPQVPKSKKKKGENAQYQQLIMCPEGMNVNLLGQLLAEVPLSRSEIQILTECLLNKQNGPLPEHTEWSEGPKDPLQKLKKQLAEKEKALTDEQEAMVAVQAKLKELRASLNAERSRCTQITQSSEENVNVLRNENVGLQARIQRGIDENNSLRQQVVQLQKKVAAESDWSSQLAKMEMHIQALSEKNNSLAGSLAGLQAENAELHEAHSAGANELHVARDHIRRLEEIHRMYEESEITKTNLLRSEQMLKQEVRQLNDRLKALAESQAEVQRLSSAQTYSQQEAIKHEQKREELDRQNVQFMNDITKLKTEKEELNKTIADLKEKLASQPTPNGTSTPDKDDAVSVEKAVAAVRLELEERHTQQLDLLQRQLDQHRDKNNDLRTKNWKVMEALQAAEKKLQQNDASKTSDDSSIRDAVAKACSDEQNKNKELLQRLFPQVSVEASNNDDWFNNFAEKANKVLNEAKSRDAAVEEHSKKTKELVIQNEKLQNMIENYKTITSDMDKALDRLQDKANEEDQKWQRKIGEKQKELDDLKEVTIIKMQKQIESLQSDLETERKIKGELDNNLNNPLNNSNKTMSGEMADIERLLEENSRLRETVEKLQNASQSLNGPTQLLPITTFEHKSTKKRRTIAGWLRRKITFKRKKKSREMQTVDKRKSTLLEEKMDHVYSELSGNSPDR